MANKKPQSKAKRIWMRVLAVILLVVGLCLIFNQQISTFVINHMTQTSMQTKITPRKTKHANFDFSKVNSLNNKTIGKAMFQDKDAIGKIAIPSVGIRLPIFYGLDNGSLARGTGTMKPDEQMGVGNYCLAGHHMENPNVLFGRLHNVKKGGKVYLTNGKKVYTYKVTEKVTVYKTQVQWINDTPDKKIITLVTCASGTPGEVNRTIVRGDLVGVHKADKQTLKVFE